jgi:nitrite reductase/ring-hydroxylating ferredoxin subunit
VNDLIAIHTKQSAYQTYVIGARIPSGSVTRALYWDTPDPYHYIRIETVGQGAGVYDVLIVGGEDHKTGQEDDANKRFGALERWTRHRFPMVEEIVYRWSGEVLEPVDGLAFIGPNPLDEKNVFIATGDSGNGMTHGTIAGILLTDLIVGRKNPWEEIYKPSRIPLKALPQFAKENLNVAMQYTDLLVAGDVSSIDEIKPGAGAVLSRGLSKVAVYRDPQGKTHELSAVCRHLGCIVNWNTSENTWDCPCHGSRYDALGKVIQGPANRDLVEEKSNGERVAVSKQKSAGVSET